MRFFYVRVSLHPFYGWQWREASACWVPLCPVSNLPFATHPTWKWAVVQLHKGAIMPKLVTPTKNTLTHDEKRLVEAYRALSDPESKRLILITVETFSESQKSKQAKPKLSLVGAENGGNHA